MALEEEKLFKAAAPDNHGFFVLMKSVMVAEGLDGYPRMGRCDNLSYSPVNVAVGTEYEDEATTAIRKSPYAKVGFTLNNIGVYEIVFDASPHFYICYFEMVEKTPTGNVPARHLEKGDSPSSLWVAKTFNGLLKNMREWSFMLDEPFNSNHPMAQYSKKFFEVSQMPENLVQEIDAYPDMYLARFLKGESGYRDEVYPFPVMSNDMKSWVSAKMSEFSKKSLGEIISEI